jgi:beta-N-acetylhexosaminidase
MNISDSSKGGHAPVVIDIAGVTLSADDRRRIQHPCTGGLIFFTRNWRDREQISELSQQIKAVRPDLLICVDQEGGRVQRFRAATTGAPGLTVLPPMRRLHQFWQQTEAKDPLDATLVSLQAATAVGYVLAAELRACGVDLSFTPVLDLDFGHSAVIGDRSFGRDPQAVALLAKSLMHGLLLGGMANCGKHFPGHGYAVADSHLDVPVDERSLEQVMQEDIRPYAGLRQVLRSVMPAHIVYPQVDDVPAGFSRRWLQEILRGQLRFNGLIFSDDLSMEGARFLRGQALSPLQAAHQALQAGCDMVLLCNQSLGEGQVLDELLDGLERSRGREWHPNSRSEARRRELLPCTPALNWNQLQKQEEYTWAIQIVEQLSLPAHAD